MITSRKAPKRAGKRIVSVGVALGIAMAAGALTAASASAMTPVHSSKATLAQASHGYGGDDDGCSGLIVILCN
ncbi:hypothetical protein OIA45_18435 [Streptomyces chartreusis]|uniref:hypothetical protein n=1 Tax=Streptomyces chartreusis TaxID=1969 RepID=UPI0033C919DC|nr:hypothetical protein OIA45_18435 [Streptomyces chartreusis]